MDRPIRCYDLDGKRLKDVTEERELASKFSAKRAIWIVPGRSIREATDENLSGLLRPHCDYCGECTDKIFKFMKTLNAFTHTNSEKNRASEKP